MESPNDEKQTNNWSILLEECEDFISNENKKPIRLIQRLVIQVQHYYTIIMQLNEENNKLKFALEKQEMDEMDETKEREKKADKIESLINKM